MYQFGIIVPFYNEKFTEVLPCIRSIELQDAFDMREVKVYFVCDGSDNLDVAAGIDKESVSFAYEFIYMQENKGPGVARQVGLDAADDCRYVMFIDADDHFCSTITLHTFLLNIMAHNNPDFLLARFFEELKETKADRIADLFPHIHDITWMFGKCYRRDFLMANSISFHPDFRVQEDSYFNYIVDQLSKNTIKMDDIVYIWKWREHSITRINGGIYTYNSFGDYIGAMKAAIENIRDRGIHVGVSAAHTLFYAYYTMQAPEWEEHREHKKKAEDAIRNFCEVLGNEIDQVPLETQYQIKQAERAKSAVFMEVETFPQFIERIKMTRKGKAQK